MLLALQLYLDDSEQDTIVAALVAGKIYRQAADLTPHSEKRLDYRRKER